MPDPAIGIGPGIAMAAKREVWNAFCRDHAQRYAAYLNSGEMVAICQIDDVDLLLAPFRPRFIAHLCPLGISCRNKVKEKSR